MSGHIDLNLKLKIINMKKLVVYNDQHQKLFCRYEITDYGFLSVYFYLPKEGFSIRWIETKYARIRGIYSQEDKRGKEYSRVDYLVHPAAWLGNDFDSKVWKTPQGLCSAIATTIKLL